MSDRGFQSLMKTGRPEYHIPSEQTVSRDVKQVFVHARKRWDRPESQWRDTQWEAASKDDRHKVTTHASTCRRTASDGVSHLIYYLIYDLS